MHKRTKNLASAIAMLLTGCGGTTVELANRSANTMDNVSVEFTGGATSPKSILAGQETVVSLNPTGESHLKVWYRSSAGSQSCVIDTYLEPDYRARFRIELQEKACRVTVEEISLPPLYGFGS